QCVEETVHRGPQGTQPHQIGVGQVDPDLDTDQICRRLTHGACGEGIQQGAATQSQVDQFHTASIGGDDGPDGGGTRSVGAVADGAAVVQPHTPLGAGDGFDGSIGTQRHELGGLVVGQPDLHVLAPSGQTFETQGTGLAAGGGARSGGCVELLLITPDRTALCGEPAVHTQVVDSVRASRGPHVAGFARDGVQFDHGGASA